MTLWNVVDERPVASSTDPLDFCCVSSDAVQWWTLPSIRFQWYLCVQKCSSRPSSTIALAYYCISPCRRLSFTAVAAPLLPLAASHLLCTFRLSLRSPFQQRRGPSRMRSPNKNETEWQQRKDARPIVHRIFNDFSFFLPVSLAASRDRVHISCSSISPPSRRAISATFSNR